MNSGSVLQMLYQSTDERKVTNVFDVLLNYKDGKTVTVNNVRHVSMTTARVILSDMLNIQKVANPDNIESIYMFKKEGDLNDKG